MAVFPKKKKHRHIDAFKVMGLIQINILANFLFP